MAEAADDLSAPLGQSTPRRKRRLRLPFTAMQLLAVLLGLFLVTFAGFAIFGDNPLGGEPIAHIALRQPNSAEEKTAQDNAADDKAAPATPAGHDRAGAGSAAPGEKTVTIIDGSSGARHDVVISGENSGKQGDAPPASMMAGIDQRLLENSRYGLIPAMSGDIRPFTAYAAPADQAKAAQMPVISIVIGGLGVGAAKTADAIMKLPPAVTLAFTPYGSDPAKLAERARAQGHEIFLQVPMEPYDYPDNDPGPQTLLSGLGADQNLDRLTWHLARLRGYAGVANFMGARFVATEPAMQPIIGEISRRGLGFFDDGSAPRSVAASLAASQAMPFARGDVQIDAVPTPAEIDHALSKLETTAKERGYAIGTASALPVAIERIAAWLKTLDAHGILLVPLTTTMLKSKSS